MSRKARLLRVTRDAESEVIAFTISKVSVREPQLRDTGVLPARAADDVQRAFADLQWIDCGARAAGLYSVEVVRPLGDVAAEIEETHRVCGEAADRRGDRIAVVVVGQELRHE